jgi:hypothetical protein
MPSYTTYAFEDLHTTIAHPANGQISVQGAGIGTITFAMANDVSAHDVAADGSVMTSKIKSGNGTIAIACQQTSDLHRWLLRLYNYLDSAPSREWAGIGVLSSSPDMQVQHTGEHVSIQKKADKPYQQQGQQVTWTLMAAKLTER